MFEQILVEDGFEQILVEDGQVGQLVAHRILEEVGDGIGVVG